MPQLVLSFSLVYTLCSCGWLLGFELARLEPGVHISQLSSSLRECFVSLLLTFSSSG